MSTEKLVASINLSLRLMRMNIGYLQPPVYISFYLPKKEREIFYVKLSLGKLDYVHFSLENGWERNEAIKYFK